MVGTSVDDNQEVRDDVTGLEAASGLVQRRKLAFGDDDAVTRRQVADQLLWPGRTDPPNASPAFLPNQYRDRLAE